MNERIAEYDRLTEQIAKAVHPEVALLENKVKGVETPIALTYVLTVRRSTPILPQPGRGDTSSDCAPGAGTPVRANHNCTSARKETVISGR